MNQVLVISTKKGLRQLETSCYPKTSLPKIDSSYQKGNQIALLFDSTTFINDITIRSNYTNLNVSNYDSVILIPFKPVRDTIFITIEASNGCGQSNATFEFSTIPIQISEIKEFKENGIRIHARKVNDTWWMTGDLQNENSSFRKSKDCDCPSGWQIPSEMDWLNLLGTYSYIYLALFDSPEIDNIGLGFVKNGAKNGSGDHLFKDERAFYWYKEGHKMGVVIITESGELFVSEELGKIEVPLRCIKK